MSYFTVKTTLKLNTLSFIFNPKNLIKISNLVHLGANLLGTTCENHKINQVNNDKNINKFYSLTEIFKALIKSNSTQQILLQTMFFNQMLNMN